MRASYFWNAIIIYGCLKLKMYSYFSIENNIRIIIIRIPFEPTLVYFTIIFLFYHFTIISSFNTTSW